MFRIWRIHSVQIDVRCGCLLHRDFPPLPGHASLKWPYVPTVVLNPHRLLITPKCPRSWVACRFPFHLVHCFQLQQCSADYHLWGSRLREERLFDRKGRIVQKSVVLSVVAWGHHRGLHKVQATYLMKSSSLKKLTLVLFDDKTISSWRLHKFIKKSSLLPHRASDFTKSSGLIKSFTSLSKMNFIIGCSLLSSAQFS